MRVLKSFLALMLLVPAVAAAASAAPEASVVPEPITMILVGSGLAGIGGAKLLKRRKKDRE
jgi:hypothetical protein